MKTSHRTDGAQSAQQGARKTKQPQATEGKPRSATTRGGKQEKTACTPAAYPCVGTGVELAADSYARVALPRARYRGVRLLLDLPLLLAPLLLGGDDRLDVLTTDLVPIGKAPGALPERLVVPELPHVVPAVGENPLPVGHLPVLPPALHPCLVPRVEVGPLPMLLPLQPLAGVDVPVVVGEGTALLGGVLVVLVIHRRPGGDALDGIPGAAQPILEPPMVPAATRHHPLIPVLLRRGVLGRVGHHPQARPLVVVPLALVDIAMLPPVLTDTRALPFGKRPVVLVGVALAFFADVVDLSKIPVEGLRVHPLHPLVASLLLKPVLGLLFFVTHGAAAGSHWVL
eukprot:CAMPEP_0204416152 /NCGR_PEP_ID=MMETSP0470-20130426/24363_1 /ASSEMBLY_ACC=CAM_ASM_000385 /TAXON_ID=2969 /ORGANISM="Oxyrrhis marina" /LENGTH=341 /DNA_ID=CAMNT_0051412595 /DNA_START=10 /DNA_END=1035 /DNA_ORIENTATION=+